MRTPCCHSFVAFILKFFNFLLTFIGISILVYSAYMLNQLNNHSFSPSPPPPLSAPSPDYPETLFSNFEAVRILDQITPLNLPSDDGMIKLHAPAPWFIYAFMGLGVVLCCITCIGHIAAEAINGFCLCCYSLLTTVLILLEVALVVFIALDHHWERDLPFDPTGELDALRGFVEANLDLCKWVGILVVIIQALSLLFAIILRAMVSSQRLEEENDDIEEPLLNPQVSQTSSCSITGNGKGVHSDIWSSRMRQKYGLNSGDANYNSLNQNASVDMKT
ncbi:hypothetical protein LguiB_030777 [Lonicera macranthoides]